MDTGVGHHQSLLKCASQPLIPTGVIMSKSIFMIDTMSSSMTDEDFKNLMLQTQVLQSWQSTFSHFLV
jgi:hypothetical protein